MNPNVHTALEDLAYARESHLRWAEHLEAHSEEPCSECASKPFRLDADREREWVRKYDNIIAVIKGMGVCA